MILGFQIANDFDVILCVVFALNTEVWVYFLLLLI
jgi:hypothetical protein